MDNKYSKACPEEFQKEAYERIINSILTKKSCLKCSWKIKQIWRWSFECELCNSKFKTKPETSLFKDLSDSRNWKANCSECSWIMDFNETRFAYYCRKCWNVLEV